MPEIALTALTIEALTPVRSRQAHAACERGRAFLRCWPLTAQSIPAALDPALCTGAFVATPITPLLRGDVTAHALLALHTT